MGKSKVFLDIGPLQEVNFTGISTVTAALAHFWLVNYPETAEFFVGPHLIDAEVVRDVLAVRNGAILTMLINQRKAVKGYLHNALKTVDVSAAIFPNVKSFRNKFDLEYQVIHDLSFLVTPEFHHHDTIVHHASTIANDLVSNARTICVSQATADDVITYFKMDPARIVVSTLGTDTGQIASSLAGFFDQFPSAPERFVLVLGTIEPRKNIDIVLQMLANKPGLLSEVRFLFAGGSGWLISFEERIANLGLSAHYRAGQIGWLGYVTELEKVFLYKYADMVIYPSIFEGFGLPVIEAMSVGTPVVSSYSSSLPEAGGSLAFYFDPLSVKSLESAVVKVLSLGAASRRKLAAASMEYCEDRTWAPFNRTIAATIMADLQSVRAAA